MSLKQDTLNKTSGFIFTIIAILHLLRLIYSWPAQIGTFAVPIWLSLVAVVISAYISYSAFNLTK